MKEIKPAGANSLRPIAGLLFAATLWGIVWYPYRLLRGAGMGGEVSTLVTYLVALFATLLLFPRAIREFARAPLVLSAVALSAGWCNFSYVLAVLNGEVIRVLLLFYLAPLWTVPLARLILREHTGRVGYLVVLLAFCGAVVMLWNPAAGLPIPSNRVEWLGLSAGFTFALSNVLVRRATGCGVVVKTLSVFVGVTVVSALALLLGDGSLRSAAAPGTLPLVLVVAAMLIGMSLAVQYGLAHVPATRAIVIMLFELLVAAVAAYWLADEVMGPQEWLGGMMIVAASLFSGHIKHEAGVMSAGCAAPSNMNNPRSPD